MAKAKKTTKTAKKPAKKSAPKQPKQSAAATTPPAGETAPSTPDKDLAKDLATAAEGETAEARTVANKAPSRIARYVKVWGRLVLGSSVPEILLVASLVISKYLPNSDFSYPSEIITPIVLFGVLITIFFYIFKLILKSSLAAHTAALPLAYGLYAYSYAYPRLHRFADTITPDSLATPFTSALVTVLVWATVFGFAGFALARLIKHFKQLQELPLLKIAVFAICVIFVMQFGKLGQRMWTIQGQLGYKYSPPTLQQDKAAVKDASKPNVYYLVFDRYASNETLKRTYNYDNSKMTDFLAGQGFVTRQDAYANYPFTTQSISSTLTMDYHKALGDKFENDAPGFQTAFPYRKMLDKSLVSETFKQNGYAYNQVSSWWDFSRGNPTADNEPTQAFRLRVAGKQFWMTDLQRDIINKSVLSPFLLKGLTLGDKAVVKYDRDYNPRQNFEEQLAALTRIAKSSTAQQKPQFTFAHILSPHDPYVFTETGEAPLYSGDRIDDGVDETVKYDKQLTYVNGRFQNVISDLRAKDPGAVIIIQADEGPYPKQFRGTLTPSHYYDPINLPLEQMQQKFGIVASYYLPGVDPDTAKEQMNSSVNTFRFVLSHYLGYKLEQLPDCQFTAGNKYYMYKYQLVSGKLRGTPEPEACKPYQ